MNLDDQYHFLLNIRKKHKLLRLELCALLGVTASILWQWETGKTKLRKPYVKLLTLMDDPYCMEKIVEMREVIQDA